MAATTAASQLDELAALYRRTIAPARDTSEALALRGALLHEFKWLTSMHTNDWFAVTAGDRLPAPFDAWFPALEQLDRAEILALPLCDSLAHLPDPLARYIERARALRVDTRFGETPAWFGGLIQLDGAFKKSMGGKKRSEVACLAPFVAALAHVRAAPRGLDASAIRIVDLGSGKGYVSQLLALRYGFRLVCVEGNADYHAKSLARLDQLDREMRRVGKQAAGGGVGGDGGAQATAASRSLLCPVVAHLEPNLCWARLEALLAEQHASLRAGQTAGGRAAPDEVNVLLGLHTCGDLASTTMRLFAEPSSPFEALVCVPCCYTLLTQAGYPTSSGLADLAPSSATLPLHEERNLACQNLPKWRAGLADGSLVPAVQQLMFRSLIEPVLRAELLRQRGLDGLLAASLLPDGRSAAGSSLADVGLSAADGVLGASGFPRVRANGLQLGCLSSTPGQAFRDYALAVLRHVALIQPSVSDDDAWDHLCGLYPILLQDCGHDSRLAKHFFAYIALRFLLSPVLESLILLDHVQFLTQQPGVTDAFLIPLFDPAESPRSVAVVGLRAGKVPKWLAEPTS